MPEYGSTDPIRITVSRAKSSRADEEIARALSLRLFGAVMRTAPKQPDQPRMPVSCQPTTGGGLTVTGPPELGGAAYDVSMVQGCAAGVAPELGLAVARLPSDTLTSLRELAELAVDTGLICAVDVPNAFFRNTSGAGLNDYHRQLVDIVETNTITTGKFVYHLPVSGFAWFELCSGKVITVTVTRRAAYGNAILDLLNRSVIVDLIKRTAGRSPSTYTIDSVMLSDMGPMGTPSRALL